MEYEEWVEASDVIEDGHTAQTADHVSDQVTPVVEPVDGSRISKKRVNYKPYF